MNWQMMLARLDKRRQAQKPLSRLSVFLSFSAAFQWFTKHDKSFAIFGEMNFVYSNIDGEAMIPRFQQRKTF